MIRNNLSYKLFALAIALVLWTYVNSERNPQLRKTFSVPIQTHNLAKGYTAAFENTDKVAVTVEGPKSSVEPIGPGDVTAWVTLSEMHPGTTREVQEPRIRVRVASSDASVRYTPRRTKLRVEALSWKRLPVEVKFLSAPPLGYAYGDPLLSPASVGLSGRTTSVSRVKRVILALSKRHDRGGSVNGAFEVVPVDASGNAVTDVKLDVETVRLKLNFVEVPATKAVIVSPNVVGSPSFPARVTRVTVIPTSVTLEGKPSALMELSTVSTDPISIDGEQQNVSTSVQLDVPPGIKVLGGTSVRVNIQISNTQ